MVECKLARLVTSFCPEKIRLLIELAPLDGQAFDLPMDEAGSKLSAVANYARVTFGVRTPPSPGPASPLEPASRVKTPPKDRAEKRQEAFSRTLKGGGDRAIRVLEDELARARVEGNPAAVQRAQEQLDRARSFLDKTQLPK